MPLSPLLLFAMFRHYALMPLFIFFASRLPLRRRHVAADFHYADYFLSRRY
jgi:hypothetical protein